MTSKNVRSFTGAYRAVMTAVFVGIGVALTSLVFNIIYRSGGVDFSEDLLNVSCLIFGNLLIFLLIGVVYMVLHIYAPRADLIFILLFVVLTILGWMAVSSGHFDATAIVNARFQGMLKGLLVLIGIASTCVIPLLYHSRKFEKYVV